MTYQLLPAFGSDTASFARDVSMASPRNTVGYSQDDPQHCSQPACDGATDAVTWGPDALEPADFNRIITGWGGVPLGMNDASYVVGWANDQGIPPGQCVANATLWFDNGATPPPPLPLEVNLGNLCSLDADEATIANAVANITPLQVVGTNKTSDINTRAVLWENVPGCDAEWSYIDLDAAACDCNNTFILREAVDINDNGWILVRERATIFAEDRAYLLRPVDQCPNDLNGDGVVNQPDVIILMDNWTPEGKQCDPCSDLCCACIGDLDGDCHVTQQDLNALLAVYCSVPALGPAPAPRSLEARRFSRRRRPWASKPSARCRHGWRLQPTTRLLAWVCCSSKRFLTHRKMATSVRKGLSRCGYLPH